MRRRRAILMSTATALLIFMALRVLWQGREPSYRGRSLSSWALQFDESTWDGRGPAATLEAEVAIKAIGPEAIPHLIGWIAWKPSRLKARFIDATRSRFPAIAKGLVRTEQDRDRRGYRGALCFWVLRQKGRAAVPGLTQLLNDKGDRGVQVKAEWALEGINKTALPKPVADAAQDSLRKILIREVTRQPSAARTSLPAILNNAPGK